MNEPNIWDDWAAVPLTRWLDFCIEVVPTGWCVIWRTRYWESCAPSKAPQAMDIEAAQRNDELNR